MTDHYLKHSIEAIDVINDWDLNYNLGASLKYIARCRYKGEKHKDIRKAINYLRYEIYYDIVKQSKEDDKPQYDPDLRYDDDLIEKIRGGM